jgi:hypothetical protein
MLLDKCYRHAKRLALILLGIGDEATVVNYAEKLVTGLGKGGGVSVAV